MTHTHTISEAANAQNEHPQQPLFYLTAKAIVAMCAVYIKRQISERRQPCSKQCAFFLFFSFHVEHPHLCQKRLASTTSNRFRNILVFGFCFCFSFSFFICVVAIKITTTKKKRNNISVSSYFSNNSRF